MMKRPMTLACLALVPALLAAGPAAAQVQTSVSGLLYTEYSAPTDGRAAAFNVTRAFLTGHATFNDIWSGSITYNAYPQNFVADVKNGNATLGSEFYDALLHNAYVQAKGLIPNVNLQMGLLTSPWFEFENSFWGYRMLGFHYFPVFNNGYINAFDFGLKAFGSLGPVAYSAQVDNGSGFRSVENDGRKAFTGVLSVTPVSGLTVAALGHRGDNPNLEQADRYAAFAGYRNGSFRAAAEATRMVTQAVGGTAVNAQVLSAYTVLGLPIPVLPTTELVARVDALDRNLDAAPVAGQAETLQGLVGLSIKPTPGVTLTLDDQIAQDTVGGVTTTRNTVALHTQVAF